MLSHGTSEMPRTPSTKLQPGGLVNVFLSPSDAECLHHCLGSYTYYYGVLLSLSGFNDVKQEFGTLHTTHGTLS